mmetsp:Transcript_24743/g.37603  ORF Transcript_24743/g.37603 Transcript_24743/m.37603 type:complete len:325 (-) Transcript_24743:35-1009(-)
MLCALFILFSFSATSAYLCAQPFRDLRHCHSQKTNKCSACNNVVNSFNPFSFEICNKMSTALSNLSKCCDFCDIELDVYENCLDRITFSQCDFQTKVPVDPTISPTEQSEATFEPTMTPLEPTEGPVEPTLIGPVENPTIEATTHPTLTNYISSLATPEVNVAASPSKVAGMPASSPAEIMGGVCTLDFDHMASCHFGNPSICLGNDSSECEDGDRFRLPTCEEAREDLKRCSCDACKFEDKALAQCICDHQQIAALLPQDPSLPSSNLTLVNDEMKGGVVVSSVTTAIAFCGAVVGSLIYIQKRKNSKLALYEPILPTGVVLK